MKNFIKSNLLWLVVASALSIAVLALSFSIDLKSEVESLQIVEADGNGQIAGGVSRIAIGSQVKWTTDLIPSASFTVDLGSAALPVDDYFGGGASFSRNISFAGELKPDGDLCSNGQILKRTAANNWDCAADNSASFDATAQDALTWSDGANASNLWTFDLSGTDPTLNFISGGFDFTGFASVSTNFEADGYASASFYLGTSFTSVGDCNDSTEALRWTTTGIFSCGSFTGGDGITITADDIDFVSTELEALTWGAGGNATNVWTHNLSAGDPTWTWTTSGASLSLNFEAIGYASASAYLGTAFTTVGDCNDDGEAIGWTTTGVFICNTLADADIPDTISLIGGTIGANNISGTQTTTGTLTIGDNGDAIVIDSSVWDISSLGVASFVAVGSHSFGGSVEPVTDGLGSLGTTAKTWGQAVASLVQAFVKFILPARTASNINETGASAIDTASSSFNFHDGTAERILKDVSCFSVYIEDPTSTNDKWIGHKRFNDPFTITSVQSVASGSNAAGWNIYHGVPGTVTTTLFTTNRSASTSAYNTYTTFNDATLLDGEVLDVVITSVSATLQSFAPTICGRSVK